jgi:hypothetical protein
VGDSMKKRSEYVPLEISGNELEAFVNELEDKLYSQFWSLEEDKSKKEQIKGLIRKNIYLALENAMR